jgi:hypothetical protein
MKLQEARIFFHTAALRASPQGCSHLIHVMLDWLVAEPVPHPCSSRTLHQAWGLCAAITAAARAVVLLLEWFGWHLLLSLQQPAQTEQLTAADVRQQQLQCQ